MENIAQLKNKLNLTTLNFVLLSIATVGIYPLVWLFKNQSVIAMETKTEIYTDTYLIWCVACFGWSGVLSVDSVTLSVLSMILSLAYSVLLIVWAFKARRALQDYCLNDFAIDLKMNAFYTLLFNVFYINYVINSLPEAYAKKTILDGNKVVA